MKKIFFGFLFLFGILFLPLSVSAVEKCCTYYIDGNQDECVLFGYNSNNNQVEPIDDYLCSAYNEDSGTIDLGDGDSFEISGNEFVLPTNFTGGYKGDGTMRGCIEVEGHHSEILVLSSINVLDIENLKCSVALELNETTPFGNSLMTGLKNYIMLLLEEKSKEYCCISTVTRVDNRCHVPDLNQSFLDATLRKESGDFVSKLALSADNSIINYYQCGDPNKIVVGYSCASSELMINIPGLNTNVSTASINDFCAMGEVYRKEKYCLCTNDRTTCGPEHLETKEDCDKAVRGKSNMECVPVEKDPHGGNLRACKSFERDPVVVAPSISENDPFGDVKNLNRLGTTDPRDIIARIIKTGMGIMGSIALVMFVYAGFIMMIGTTDVVGGASKKDVAKAKGILVWSSLGLIVILSSYALVNFVLEIFS